MNSSGTDDEQIETGDGAIELLSVRAADEIMRKVTAGAMYVEQVGDCVMLRQVGQADGFRLLGYQMTPGGLARAVKEVS